MNLLIFIHSLHAGGAERVTTNIANHWAEKGWQVTVVTQTSADQDFYQLHPAVTRIALDVAGGSKGALTAITNNLNRIRALRRIIKQVKPSVALAMMSTANILLALAAIELKYVRTVGSERTYPPSIPLGRAWEKLRYYFYGHLDALVALTEESAIWLRQNTRAGQIHVIPNPVNWPMPTQVPHLVPLKRVSGKYTLLAVGRLSEEKGFTHLISIFQRLVPHFPDWKLVILGDGPDRSTLQKQIASAGLEAKILLPGKAGNVGEWYSAADLYVLSSRFEGFPNTLVEAMAHGLAVVSFDCDTGPRDIIRHEVDGLLVPSADVRALEAALSRSMSDTRLRQRLATRAIEVRDRFSAQKITGMWENLFKELT